MRRLLIALLLLALPSLAEAHGGLPVSLRVLRAGDTIYVPVYYWGVWVGGLDGRPWTWICEEVINGFKLRTYAVAADGMSFYATDQRGLTVSLDQGCTWTAVTGELVPRRVGPIVADLTDPKTAWLTTRDGFQTLDDGGVQAPDNALYITHDRGVTWSRLPGLASQSARQLSGLAIAPGKPMTIYVASVSPNLPSDPKIHRSDDGGQTFMTFPLTNMVDSQTPYSLELPAIDPRNEKVVYLRAFATGKGVGREALLRSSDGGQTFTELWKQDGVELMSGLNKGIDGVAIDGVHSRVYVATTMGVLAGDEAGTTAAVTLAPSGNLSQAQCVDIEGDKLLACSNNYLPDNAALAESDDRAASFHKIMQYADTTGPVSYCPKGTPVADQCPLFWQMYADQLGISFDGGVGDGGVTPPPSGCSCRVGGHAAGAAGASLALAVLVLLFVRRRSRA